MHMHTRVYIYIHMCVLSHSVMSNCLQLQGLQLLDSSVHGNSPGKNIGVACHDLLQGIFPTQRQNPGLPHCRRILYHLSRQGSPYIHIHTHVQSDAHIHLYPHKHICPKKENYTKNTVSFKKNYQASQMMFLAILSMHTSTTWTRHTMFLLLEKYP